MFDVNVSGILKLSIEFGHICRGFYETLSNTSSPIFFLLHLFNYIEKVSRTVLLIHIKRANICVSIGMPYHARSMHQVVLVLTFVIRAVTKGKSSDLQGIVFEYAFERSFCDIVDIFTFAVELTI